MWISMILKQNVVFQGKSYLFPSCMYYSVCLLYISKIIYKILKVKSNRNTYKSTDKNNFIKYRIKSAHHLNFSIIPITVCSHSRVVTFKSKHLRAGLRKTKKNKQTHRHRMITLECLIVKNDMEVPYDHTLCLTFLRLWSWASALAGSSCRWNGWYCAKLDISRAHS